jgi:hypothetical protein
LLVVHHLILVTVLGSYCFDNNPVYTLWVDFCGLMPKAEEGKAFFNLHLIPVIRILHYCIISSGKDNLNDDLYITTDERLHN